MRVIIPFMFLLSVAPATAFEMNSTNYKFDASMVEMAGTYKSSSYKTIIPGILAELRVLEVIANITVNLALYLGSAFADDMLQSAGQ